MTEQKLVKTHALTVKVREKCLEAGLTNAYQLQIAAGIAPSVAQHLFNENFSEISLQTLEKFLEALNCTAADIFIKEKSKLQKAKEILRDARRVLILTGAGVSAESNVPTFRGGGGASVWRGMPFEQLSSAQMVEDNLPLVWEWFDYRRKIVGECQPNAAHTALSDWQRAGDFDEFTLVTQNIDGLHRRAGSSKILELHGNIWRARCLMCSETFDVRDLPADERPPVCKMCGDNLRPNVVLFGENLPVKILETAVERAEACDVCLVIGTSSLVYPAASLPEIARQAGAKIIEINPKPTALSENSDVSLRGKAGEILPQLTATVITNLSDSEKYVTQAEAAKLRGVSRQRIGQLVKSGRLKTVGEGHDALISVEDLMNLTEGKKGRPRKSEENKTDKDIDKTRKSTIGERMGMEGMDIQMPEPEKILAAKDSEQTAENLSENNSIGNIKVIPNSNLTEADIPADSKDWEIFALSFGMQDYSELNEEGRKIYERTGNLDDLSLDQLRGALLFVQRKTRWSLDSGELNDSTRKLIKDLLDAIRRKVKDENSSSLKDSDNLRGDEEIFLDDEVEAILDKMRAAIDEAKNEETAYISGKHFLLYWREENIAAHDESDYPLDVIASNQLGRVSGGDIIWLVTVNQTGELILAGRMFVDKITDYREAARIVGDSQLWEAEFYALPEKEMIESLDYIVLGETAFELRFNSPTSDRFVARDGKINAQQMQTMRELTPESARLLAEIWENTGFDESDEFDWDEDDENSDDDFDSESADVKIYGEIAAREPENADAHYNFGVALDEAGQSRRAIDAYRRTVELAPDYFEAWYNLGVCFLHFEDAHRALECFEKATEAKHDFALAYFMAGSTHGILEDYAAAIRLTVKGLEFAPNHPQALFNIGNSYWKLGKTGEALETFQHVIEIAPDFVPAYIMAGKSLESLDEFEKAVEAYKAATQIQPDSADAMILLGRAYLKLKRGKFIYAPFPETADVIDLEDARTIFYLGLAFIALGETDLARQQTEPLEQMSSSLAAQFRDLCREAEIETGALIE